MNVGELRKLLKQYPDDMEVLNMRYSDFDIVEPDEIYVVQAVPQDWGVMRSHTTMTTVNKLKEKSYLLIEGN